MKLTYSADHLPKHLFINNEYVPSRSSQKLTLFNPADNSLVANDVDVAGEIEVNSAVDAAEAALPGWKATLPSEKRRMINALADLIEQNGIRLAELSRITLGTPRGQGEQEVALTVETFRYFAGWADKNAGESYSQEDGFMKIVRHEPFGVTAGIAPWNAPLMTIALKAAPALVTGNCFILKPSEKTPLASLGLGELIKEAGFPPGVFQVLAGDGNTGALLASHMKIRKISFTGSIPTGKKIQQMAACSNLKNVTLELGGKSPAVVFDDANLENAILWTLGGILTNSGQLCFAASRVYVQEGIYEEFMQRYKVGIEARRLAIGDPSESSTGMGPLVDKSQLDRVLGFIERAQNGQGELLIGGGDVENSEGCFIEPTVFVNVDAKSEIHNEEVFGPVAVVKKFKSEEEVIEISNNSKYGLIAGVFTQDINRALRMASKFESGMVGVNCVSMMTPVAPFGGVKESGIGRENGRYALLEFTEPKTVLVNLSY